MKYFTFLILVAAALVALKFKTLNPCGIMRYEVRQSARLEGGAGAFIGSLPDDLLDALIAARFGPLSLTNCLMIAVQGGELGASRAQPPPARPLQSYSTARFLSGFGLVENAPDYLKPVLLTVASVRAECRRRRLVGELANYEAAETCAADQIRRAYDKAGYPHMELVSEMLAERMNIAFGLDHQTITESSAVERFRRFRSRIVAEEQALSD